jgi:predicted TIM-barrel fold metal-dependent hydrolase
MSETDGEYGAIDAVVNIMTTEALAHRPEDRVEFYRQKVGVDGATFAGVGHDEMLRRMDAAGIERAFLIAAKAGPTGHRASFHVPYDIVANAVELHPDRFSGLAGIDPTQGMSGVRELQHAVRELGFIGAHVYPHWFELAPDHARYYPFYAKCVELAVPIQLQVGQSLIYSKEMPRRSVGQPITLDAVACDFPELTIIGIHIGIPWTQEMIAMAWKHANVFIGTDAHSPKYWPPELIHFINSYGQDKVIFGTDFPVLGFERTRAEIDAIDLKPRARRKLLRDNVLRIYGLTD